LIGERNAEKCTYEPVYLTSLTDQHSFTMETSTSLSNIPNTADAYTSGLPSSSKSSSGSSRRSTSPGSVAATAAAAAAAAAAASVVVDTSPRSSCQSSSPLIDLSAIADISIEHTSNTLPGFSSVNMDRSPFQSVNERRNKLVSERANPGQHQTAQQQQQQPRLLQSQLVNMGLQAPAQSQTLHTRGLSSANWRTHRTEELPVAQPQHMYNVYDTYNAQYQGNRVMMHPNIRADQHHYFQNIGVTPFPNSGAVAENQLDGSYAYCYDRGNGQYTRLIPADMLPPLQDIPALQQGSAGMLVIPQPRGLPPNGHSSNTERVIIRVRAPGAT
jgi:hypothetical protein